MKSVEVQITNVIVYKKKEFFLGKGEVFIVAVVDDGTKNNQITQSKLFKKVRRNRPLPLKKPMKIYKNLDGHFPANLHLDFYVVEDDSKSRKTGKQFEKVTSSKGFKNSVKTIAPVIVAQPQVALFTFAVVQGANLITKLMKKNKDDVLLDDAHRFDWDDDRLGSNQGVHRMSNGNVSLEYEVIVS